MGPFTATIDGYEFTFHVEATMSAPLRWDGRYLDAPFTCKSTIELTSTPTWTLAKNWWASYVQVILQDGIYLRYTGGAGGNSAYVVKPFAVTPKDMDAAQHTYISPRCTLYDVRPGATQPVSLADVLSAPHQKALGLTSAKGTKKATVTFSDAPAVDTEKNYGLFNSTGGRTAAMVKSGFNEPSNGGGSLTGIYGHTTFGLWLVVMMNPVMQAVRKEMVGYFGDVPQVPLGPQGSADFHPLYFFEWEVDWSSTVAGPVVTARGEGMNVRQHMEGKGPAMPRLDSSMPATGVMGMQKL